jgi:hypothetical protein
VDWPQLACVLFMQNGDKLIGGIDGRPFCSAWFHMGHRDPSAVMDLD